MRKTMSPTKKSRWSRNRTFSAGKQIKRPMLTPSRAATMEARSFRDSVDIILARCCSRCLVTSVDRLTYMRLLFRGQVVSTRIKVEEEKGHVNIKRKVGIYTSWISLHEYPQKGIKNRFPLFQESNDTMSPGSAKSMCSEAQSEVKSGFMWLKHGPKWEM